MMADIVLRGYAMTSVTVTSELAKQLRQADDFVVLLDEAGEMLGSFEKSLIVSPPYDPTIIPPPLSREDIAVRLSESPMRTTAEVFERLKASE
jgi:hypothetical protein